MSDIDEARFPGGDDARRLPQIERDAEVRRQVVGCAERQDADRPQMGLRTDSGDAVDHVANGPVAARRDDRLETISNRPGGQFDRAFGPLGNRQFERHPGSAQGRLRFGPAFFGIPAVGIRVQDDFGGHIFLRLGMVAPFDGKRIST